MRWPCQLFAVVVAAAACSTPKFETLESDSGGAGASSGGVGASGGTAGSSGGAGGGDASAGTSGSDASTLDAGGTAGSGGADACVPSTESTGPLDPTFMGQVGPPEGTWVNLDKAKMRDGVGTTSSVKATAPKSNLLRALGFDAKLPAGAVIEGIKVRIWRKASTLNVTDSRVQLLKGGVSQPGKKADTATWGTAYGSAIYGAANDLWGVSWLDTDITATGFGVALEAQCTGCTVKSDVDVDHIEVEVFYHACP